MLMKKFDEKCKKILKSFIGRKFAHSRGFFPCLVTVFGYTFELIISIVELDRTEPLVACIKETSRSGDRYFLYTLIALI